MIAALIRKLILDKNSLMDQVNRKRRQKIRFIINDRSVPSFKPSPIFWSVADGFDPNTSVPILRKPIKVTKDQLLSRTVMIYKGHTFTVKELVLHIANIQGAVHVGIPKDQKGRDLKKIEEILRIGNLSQGLRLLRAIDRVIRNGLKPLKEQIME